MKNWLLFLCLSLLSTAFSQDSEVPLVCAGDVPTFLKPTLKHQSIAPTGLPVLGKRTADQLLAQKFLESGTVLFGDKVSIYCQHVLDEMTAQQLVATGKRVYAVKSTVSAAFSLNDSLYFVTTGLLAQMTSPIELKFFLLREIHHQSQQHERIREDWRKGYTTELLIEALSSYSELQDIASDKFAGELLVKSGVSGKSIIRCLDVLFFSDQAFEDEYVPLNYFSSEWMYVPPSFFATTANNLVVGQEIQSVNNRDRLFKSRKDALLKIVPTVDEVIEPVSADVEFLAARRLSRLQVVHDKIIRREFLEAQYDIFLLEKELPDSEFLKRMKAHSWYGLVYADFGQKRAPLSKKYYQKIQGESARYYKAIITLGSNGRALFALRIITDLMLAAQEDELKLEFKHLRDEITALLVASKRFQIDRCSAVPLSKLISKSAEADTLGSNKYDKLEDLRAKQYATVADTNAFYYFAISDLMADSSFVARFKQAEGTPQGKQSLPLVLITANALSFKSKKVQEEQSKKMTAELLSIASKEFALTETQLVVSEADQYNEWATIRGIIDQTQRYNNLQEHIIPVDVRSVKELEKRYGEGRLLVIQFEHQYAIVPRGYHFLGLLVAPLPFMLSDLVVGGNDLRFTACVFNTKEGVMEFIENSQSRDPAKAAFFRSHLAYLRSNLNPGK